MIWHILDENEMYEVSDTGLVRNVETKHILSGCIVSGYRSVKLMFENGKQQRFYIHRLVAKYFVPNPNPKNKTIINHIDGDKLNNAASNLEWVSGRENNLHYYRELRKSKKDKKHFETPIPVIQYDLNHNKIAEYPSISQAHKKTDIPVVQIVRCIHGEVSQANGFIWIEGSTTMRE